MFSASPSFSDTSYYYMFRYSVKNVLLIGLWYGVKKPKINSFLEGFLCKIGMLETEGNHSKSSFWVNFINFCSKNTKCLSIQQAFIDYTPKLKKLQNRGQEKRKPLLYIILHNDQLQFVVPTEINRVIKSTAASLSSYLSGLLVYNKWEDEFVTFKVHLHCCICDLPGKALVFLHKLYNGLFGCMVFIHF